MKRSMYAAAAVGMTFGFFCAAASAQPTMKSVAGTYSAISVPAFGDKPRGMLILSPDGHYVSLVGRAKLSPVAAGARNKGTDAENKALVDGSIAHFGKWTIDDGGKFITFHVEMSSYPNWDNKPQKRPLKVSGSTLTYTVMTPSLNTAPIDVSWKRVK